MANDLDERLGVCSWSLKAGRPEGLVDAVTRTGLKKIQLAISPIVKNPEAWDGLDKRLSAAGLRVVSGMFGCAGEDYSTLESIRETGGLMPDEHWATNRAHAESALEVALNLGVTKISTHAGFIPGENEAGFSKAKERVGAIADLFAAAGAELLLETGQETAAGLTAFLNVLDRPNVGVNFDPANMILYGKGDPVEALRMLMPRVRQIHLKDAVSTKKSGTWGAEARLGDGEVDWRAFLAVLEENGYAGDLIVERESGESRLDDVVHARKVILSARS